MINFQNVEKIYTNGEKQIKALNNVDLKVNKGEIYGVAGCRGAGKSTLRRCVNNLQRQTSGTDIVHGHDLYILAEKEIHQVTKNFGMIFQHFNLQNSKTVYATIAMPLILNKMPKDKLKQRVYELLDFVGLSDKAKVYPDQLSGGQKQRVGI